MSTLATVLQIVSEVASIVGIATKAGSEIAQAGRDPVKEIKRLLDARPLVGHVHGEWSELLEKRFGRETEPPQSGIEASTDDPYED